VLRALVDPNVAPIRGKPREERDLVAAARNGHVICFDNLNGLPGELADAICRLATGGGIGGRQLYTDHEEAVFEAQRPVILNGIPDFATRGDLADRALVFTLPPIHEDQRQAEAQFWERFEEARPRILGALLEAVSCALRRLSEVEPIRLARMADFCVLGMAAAPALGWSEDDFFDAYETNRAQAVEVSLEANPVATAILRLVEKDGGFDGTATDLLIRLEMHADEAKPPRGWPKDAARLGNAIRRAAPGLRQVGVDVTRDRQAGTRRITIKKKG